MKQAAHNVVILHGWGSSPNRWKRYKSSLEALFDELRDTDVKIYSPFLPGFDNKNPLKKAYSVDDYVIWLRQYLKDMGILKPILLGHSNGGRIAIRYASKYPNSPKALILVNSAGVPRKNRIKVILYIFAAKLGKILLSPIKKTPFYNYVQKLLYKTARESDYLKASSVMRSTLQNMVRYNALPDASLLRCPTLCVWADRDTLTPLWMGKKLSKTIRNSRLKIVPGEHDVYAKKPSLIAHLVQQFLKQGL